MADLEIASVAIKAETKETGSAKAAENIRKFASAVEIANAQLDAAIQVYRSAEARVKQFGSSYDEVKAKATKGIIAIKEQQVAVENLEDQIRSLTSSGEAESTKLNELNEALQEHTKKLHELEASYNGPIEASEEFLEATRRLESAQRAAEKAQGGVTKAYGSSVWEIRSYSRGISDFFSIVSTGNGTLAEYEGLLGAVVFSAAEAAKSTAEAARATGSLSGALEFLKARLAGVKGTTVLLVAATAALTFALRTIAKRNAEEKRGAQELTKILLGEKEAIEGLTEAWIRNDLVQKRALESTLDLGYSSSDLLRIYEQGAEAVHDFRRSLIELRNEIQFGSPAGEYSDEFKDLTKLIHRVESEWRQYERGALDASLVAEDAFKSSAANIIRDLQNLKQALGEGRDSANMFREAVMSIAQADLQQQSTAQNVISLLQRRKDAEIELMLARRSGTREERESLESELLGIELSLKQSFQRALDEGFDLPAAIRDLKEKAHEMGFLLTETDIQSFLPDVDAFAAATKANTEGIAQEFQNEFIAQFIQELTGAGEEITSAVLPVFESAGFDLSQGIVDGSYGLKDRMYSVLNAEIEAALERVRRETLNTGSPSKVWRDLVGIPIGEGITEGALLGLAEFFPQIDEALSLARAAVSFRQAQINIRRAEDALASAKQDLKFAKQVARELGGDTQRAEDTVSIRDAERRLALTKAAAAAGIAGRADVILAQQNLERARLEAKTYGEVVDEMKQKVEEAKLSILSAQLSMASAFISMLNAASKAGEGAIEAFKAFAKALGIPADQIRAIVQLMRQAGEVAGPIVGGRRTSGGGFSPRTAAIPPPSHGQYIIGPGGSYAFQHGGRFAGGTMGLVGEAGPELVKFDRPGEVFSNDMLRNLFSRAAGGGGTVVVGPITVPVQWPIDSIERRKIVSMIRKEIRRLDGEY